MAPEKTSSLEFKNYKTGQTRMNAHNDNTKVTETEIVYRNKHKRVDRPKVQKSTEAYQLFLKSWDMDKIELQEQFRVMLTRGYDPSSFFRRVSNEMTIFVLMALPSCQEICTPFAHRSRFFMYACESL